MQLQAKVKEQQTLHGHMWVLELSSNVRTVSTAGDWSLAAMCGQYLWLETAVFWDIMLQHLGWQVLTFWRIIMPSLPRLAQIKNSFTASGTAHPTMQNCITEHCSCHLFRPFVSREHQLHYVKCQAYEHCSSLKATFTTASFQIPDISEHTTQRVNETTWKYSRWICDRTLSFCETGSIPYKWWVYQSIWKDSTADKEQLWQMIAAFLRCYQHVHYLVLPSFISINHTYALHVAKLHDFFYLITSTFKNSS
jgi:hypothetical protein